MVNNVILLSLEGHLLRIDFLGAALGLVLEGARDAQELLLLDDLLLMSLLGELDAGVAVEPAQHADFLVEVLLEVEAGVVALIDLGVVVVERLAAHLELLRGVVEAEAVFEKLAPIPHEIVDLSDQENRALLPLRVLLAARQAVGLLFVAGRALVGLLLHSLAPFRLAVLRHVFAVGLGGRLLGLPAQVLGERGSGFRDF